MAQPRLQLYTIDMKYVRNLSKADHNVMSVNPQQGKVNRPFVGILVLINNREYCVPLTSPKAKFKGKKNSIDFMKILHPIEKDEHGAYKVLGALNFNNMLPANSSVLTPIDLTIHQNDTPSIKHYKNMMKDQLSWCQKNSDGILKRANKLYKLVTEHPEQNINLTRRCCDFKKLEAVLDKYIQKNGKEQPQPKPQASQKSHSNGTFTLSMAQLKENAKRVHEQAEKNSTPTQSKNKNNGNHNH